MSRFHSRSSAFLLVLLLLPSAAYAQAAITGVVKDTSGAILPGVTVEAASPALIEKVRSVVSDGTGQYRIVDLRPGIYSVTFALTGFTTVRREGIELTGTFVATVNGDLRVGALEETITVTGETPIVDVQSVRQQQTLSKDIIAAIPSSRTASQLQMLVPGMTGLVQDVGGSRGVVSTGAGAIHGGKLVDSRIQNDGLNTTWNGGGSGGMFMANAGGAQEVVLSTSGGMGEAEAGGVIVNVIPRDGGNLFTGSLSASGAHGSMQGDNFTQDLKDRGVVANSKLLKAYDFNPMGGGRIIRDRLWFYNTFRVIGAHNTVVGMYVNKNAGNVNAWTYDPDYDRQAFYDNKFSSASGRLTWQATPRNKMTVHWEEQQRCDACLGGGNATTAPEAQGRLFNHPSHTPQVTWSSPLTSRLLLEAGAGAFLMRYRAAGGQPRKDFNTDLIQAVEQAGVIPNIAFRAPPNFLHSTTATRSWRASVSYVTGAHSMKFGYQGGFSNPNQHFYWFKDITAYRFSSGVANQITMQAANPFSTERNLVPNAVYAQDQWTLGGLTLQGGLRYDHSGVSLPDQRAGNTRWLTVPIEYPAGSVSGVSHDDITPRVGAAYDLFGNGRTALKGNIGKYPLAQTGNGSQLDTNPLARLALSTTRSWTDTNKNYVPDCDQLNPAKNGECGPFANQAFAKRDTFNTNLDPAILNGWGVRPYQWEMGISIQHEIVRRVSLNVGYFRRWYGNFNVTENRAVGPADFDPFSVTINDLRLPGGTASITDLWNVKPGKFGIVDTYVHSAKDFGKQIEQWHGVDTILNARLQQGLTMQLSWSTGKTLLDACDVQPEVDAPTRLYCRTTTPFLDQVKGLGSYTIPLVDVQVSGTLQSNPGPQLAANYNVPSAVAAVTLLRPLAGGTANTPVNLIEPGKLYGDRVTQFDFRVAKILRFGKARAQIGFDVYNVVNAAVPLNYNLNYTVGGQWLTPIEVMPARFGKFSLQFDF